MGSLKFYEIDPKYVDYLAPNVPHMFRNATAQQNNSRKYIGIIYKIECYEYFVPLSSFKQKHYNMKETVDFIKLKDMAVVNINNMIPVPTALYTYVDIKAIPDYRYKTLLQAEYRELKKVEVKICKNAKGVYTHKLQNGNKTPLAKRCNDFKLLETLCSNYRK